MTSQSIQFSSTTIPGPVVEEVAIGYDTIAHWTAIHDASSQILKPVVICQTLCPKYIPYVCSKLLRNHEHDLSIHRRGLLGNANVIIAFGELQLALADYEYY